MKREDFTLSIESTVSDRVHFHQDIELLFNLEGSVKVILENKEICLKTEDIYVVNSNIKHSLQADKDALLVRLQIRYQTAAKGTEMEDIRFWCDTTTSENRNYEELRRLLFGMLRHYAENKTYIQTFEFLSDGYGILNCLTSQFMMRPSEMQVSEEGDKYEERLRQINHYIYQNYDHAISLRELSEKLYLSNGYLSRFFKKNYGMNFAQYLTNVRIFRAADDLRYSDESITRIAYNNGFTSAANFNKVFKNFYGQTPSEFRKNTTEHTDTVEDMKVQEERLGKLLARSQTDHKQEIKDISRITGEFDVRFYNNLSASWGTIINFGDAENLLHSTMREHLMILHQAFGFKYVRFHSLFTEEFYIRPNQEEYNFTHIDSVLDFILEQDMKPFIDLGIRSKLVVHEVGVSDLERDADMDLYTVEDWGHLMRSFMRHVMKRYGRNVLDDWKMELWFDEKWRTDEEKGNQYLERFAVTHQAVKAINENIQIGGYGIRMDAGHRRRLEFLKKWNNYSCRPDFLTVMFYGYKRGSDESEQSANRVMDNDVMINLIKREKNLIAEAGMGELPVILSEWNLTPSVRNFINDSSFKGAYIIKNTLDLYGVVQHMGYAVGSDRQTLSFDSGECIFGGGGLLTKDAIMKPAAFAYDFLNHLFPYFIGKNSHTLITTDRHDNYGIVCHNQQLLNYNYYLTPEASMDKTAMWKYYKDSKKLEIHICLDGVLMGNYRIKVYRINEKYGNIMKLWSDMDYEKELSRNELKYFRRICEPNLTIRKMEAVDGKLEIDEELQPNEITFIRVNYIV